MKGKKKTIGLTMTAALRDLYVALAGFGGAHLRKRDVFALYYK